MVIAFPAAVFPVSVAIAVKFLSAGLAPQMVPGFSIDLVGVAVPPGGAAAVGAEILLSLALRLGKRSATVFAAVLLDGFPVPLAECFQGRHRDAQSAGDGGVAASVQAHVDDFVFLL